MRLLLPINKRISFFNLIVRKINYLLILSNHLSTFASAHNRLN